MAQAHEGGGGLQPQRFFFLSANIPAKRKQKGGQLYIAPDFSGKEHSIS